MYGVLDCQSFQNEKHIDCVTVIDSSSYIDCYKLL